MALILTLNYEDPELNWRAIMNHSSPKGIVMWPKLVLSTVYARLGAENIIHPGERVWCLNLCKDVSGQEENPTGEGGWEGEAEKERCRERD